MNRAMLFTRCKTPRQQVHQPQRDPQGGSNLPFVISVRIGPATTGIHLPPPRHTPLAKEMVSKGFGE